jgi:hypothetical protein
MIPRISEARYVSGYTIWIKFKDGVEGEVDLTHELWGPVFESLKKIEVFRKFSVHPELHTIVWENGADISPEFLHNQIKVLS